MQIQCPNCNGYKTRKLGSYFLNPITLKRLWLFQPLGCLVPIVIALLGGILLWSYIPPSAVDQATTSQSSGPAFAIAFGIALIVWFIIIALRRMKLVNIGLHVTQYECNICGKQFTQTALPRSPQLAIKYNNRVWGFWSVAVVLLSLAAGLWTFGGFVIGIFLPIGVDMPVFGGRWHSSVEKATDLPLVALIWIGCFAVALAIILWKRAVKRRKSGP